jgi:hypothetical protein
MQPLSSHPAHVYCRIMNDVRDRLFMASKVAALDKCEFDFGNMVELERAMLHIRRVLECVAFASLLANEGQIRPAIRDASGMWNAKKILDAVERVNPDFFPVPAEIVRTTQGTVSLNLLPSKANILTRDDFVKLYGFTSRVIHERNPLAAEEELNVERPWREWIQRIRNLLQVHRIGLLGGEAAIVQVGGWNGKDAARFTHVGPMDKPVANGIPESRRLSSPEDGGQGRDANQPLNGGLMRLHSWAAAAFGQEQPPEAAGLRRRVSLTDVRCGPSDHWIRIPMSQAQVGSSAPEC